MGGRGSAGGTNMGKSSAGGSKASKEADKITASGITKASEMANQVYDMISPKSSKASEFSDEEKTATLRTYMDKVLQNPRSFRSNWIANQRVADFADEHGGGKKFPKLKAYKQAIAEQEKYRNTSNAMESGFRRQAEEERQRDIERRRRR